jgi:hypothetical protein
MGKMNSGKVVEATAAQSAYLATGCGEAARHIDNFCDAFGVDFRRTDTETAARRKSELYLNGHRINNGRDEIAFDAVHKAPIVKSGDIVEYIPVSYKAGDARDVSTDIPFMQAIVKSGMPLWVYLLDGKAKSVEYADGVRVDVEPATHITMRRVNLTAILRDMLEGWEICDGEGKVAFVRKHTVKAGGKEYIYPRLRVNWNKVPASYFLDAEPVPFDAAAHLPNPWA